MHIVMMTNTYLPHVGGVARSVESFAGEFRARGHRVLIVAPEFPQLPEAEEDVVRVPAIQQFNGSDFSVRLPIPGVLTDALKEFSPDIVHSHHPFLLGDAAQRVAARFGVPLVFTHHTMYERYTHYVPGDSPALQRFVIDLATSYANMCDQVLAPSESVADILRHRGVETPIGVVPTGVDVERFANGDGARLRRQFGIPADAFVVGHLGRLAPEKNLPKLSAAVGRFLRDHRGAHFLVVGTGPSEQQIRETCRRLKVHDRLHMAGSRKGQDLVDAYHAMDAFAFASQTETQGMVLTEAMAAGVPVVAIDAPGAREVVIDRKNGRLLPSQDVKAFSGALGWMAEYRDRSSLQQAARETADRFAMSRCAERALGVYNELVGQPPAGNPLRTSLDDGAWETALRMIDAEYQLWSNRAGALTTAVQGSYLTKLPVVRWIRHFWRRARRAVSRNEWAAKLLNLPRSEGTTVETGLILIQIDGLSRSQFERALHRRQCPFLRRLMTKEGYHQHTMYSGLPSSTPAVQGELFYGVKTSVPAFSFRDTRTEQVVRMFDPEPSAEVQRRLSARSPGLLEGGSAYCNIYSGGADEPHFCAATLGWGDFLGAANPLSIVVFFLFHIFSVARIGVLLLIEFCVAVLDFFRGLIAGQSFFKELSFIPTRVGICVLMRELNVIGASIDATRGLPVIHVNFLGYDEQAHRRGPSSAFAHWSLRGIDHAIRRIWDAAHHSLRRDYHVWVYSDHGQEQVVAYPSLTGKSIHEAVDDVLSQPRPGIGQGFGRAERGIEHQRSRWMGSATSSRLLAGWALPKAFHETEHQKGVVVTAMGPIGHVYLPADLGKPSYEQLTQWARRLVTEARVPLVLARHGDEVVAWTERGCFHLPGEGAALLSPSHPFLEHVADDLVALCQHPDAGQLVLSGWREGHRSVSFAQENGAHAGPGVEETRGFALLPPEVSLSTGHGYFRPIQLREAALKLLHRRPARRSPASRRVRAETLRVLTYNVHSCIGMDGRMSPRRIARVIAQLKPDIVALQEVDVGRLHSEKLDQAHLIARELQMEYHFHPAWQVEEEKYGNAVLSVFPIRLVEAGKLPEPATRRRGEPRSAMWVQVSIEGRRLHVVNTHLGLSAPERSMQVAELLSQRWLGRTNATEPCIVCGDFNMLPRSPDYRQMCQRFSDAQLALDSHRPGGTWSSAYPVGRVDHVFLSNHFQVVKVEIRRSQLARTASDHLPLLVELRMD